MTDNEALQTLQTVARLLHEMRQTLRTDPRGAAVSYELGRAVGALHTAIEQLRQ